MFKASMADKIGVAPDQHQERARVAYWLCEGVAQGSIRRDYGKRVELGGVLLRAANAAGLDASVVAARMLGERLVRVIGSGNVGVAFLDADNNAQKVIKDSLYYPERNLALADVIEADHEALESWLGEYVIEQTVKMELPFKRTQLASGLTIFQPYIVGGISVILTDNTGPQTTYTLNPRVVEAARDYSYLAENLTEFGHLAMDMMSHEDRFPDILGYGNLIVAGLDLGMPSLQLVDTGTFKYREHASFYGPSMDSFHALGKSVEYF